MDQRSLGRLTLVAYALAASCVTLDVTPGTLEITASLSNASGIDSMDYSLGDAFGYSKFGSLATTRGASTVHAEISDIPDGTGYTLQLSARASDNHASCSGTGHFDIVGHRTTKLSVTLDCLSVPTSTGSGSPRLSDCLPQGSPSATPTDDSTMFTLHALSSNANPNNLELSFTWSTTQGTLDDSNAQDPLFTCPDMGGYITVSLKITSGTCFEGTSVSVFCPSPRFHCLEQRDPPAANAPSDASEAVAYQIDAQHTGAQPNDSLRLPLKPRWMHDFAAGGVSYPLVASGRVFVTVGQPRGASLYALAADSGKLLWGPVELGGSYPWSNATYEAGRVFALNSSGQLTAYAADSGQQLWVKQLPGQYSFSSAPTAFGGRVYVGGAGSGGTVYGVDESDGVVLWTASVENGDDSSPAVSAAGVFVSYACNQAYGFELACGKPLWHHAGRCEGGGGKTVALIDEHVYTRDFDGDLVLDAKDGTVAAMYDSARIPAGSGGMLYTISNGVLSARRAGSDMIAWSFGDKTLTSAPIKVGQHIVVGSSSGTLSVLSAADGSLASSYQLSAPIPMPDEQNVSAPLTGLAAAGDQLYVPVASTLTAF